MPFYVYIILCKGGSFYTGYTKNVEERAKLHANGRGSKYTKMYPPKKVAYVEELCTRSEAMKREKAIKKFSHQQKQTLVNSYKLKKAKERKLLKMGKSKTDANMVNPKTKVIDKG
jgi:putative endonuclease